MQKVLYHASLLNGDYDKTGLIQSSLDNKYAIEFKSDTKFDLQKVL